MAVTCLKEEANRAKRRRIERRDSRSEEHNRKDLISLLPDDCLRHVFSFLSSSRDRCSSAAVSKRWLLLLPRLVPCFSEEHDGDAAKQRCFLRRKASDLRLADVAIGSTRSGSPSEIHIHDFSLRSSLSVGVPDMGFSFVASVSKLTLTGSFLTDHGLINVSQKASKLESLVLEKCHRVTSEGLMAALRNLSPSVRSISLIECNEVGRALTREQESSWKVSHLLRSVTINGCPMVCDEFLYSLGKTLVGTKSLNFVNLAGISDVGFIFLLGAMPRRDALRSIDLSGCKRITDWSLAAIATAAGDSLRTLALERCDR